MKNTAFVFPGQGSQSVGMLKGLSAYAEIDECLQIANQVLNIDLIKIIDEDLEGQLNQTQWTQPALLAVSVGIFQTLKSRRELDISLMAGHSLGEYSALVCAGSLSLDVAIELVHKRGLYMQKAVPAGTGSMAAVLGLEADIVEQICQQVQQSTTQTVSPANYNSPGQIVIAGANAAVATASQLCVDAGAKKVMSLDVSVPSHCELMRTAAEQLSVELTSVDIRPPQVPILHNVDVGAHDDPEVIKTLLVEQLYSPVCWAQTMQAIQQKGIEVVAECGPGKVLSGLFKRFDRSVKVIPLLNEKGIESLIADY